MVVGGWVREIKEGILEKLDWSFESKRIEKGIKVSKKD